MEKTFTSGSRQHEYWQQPMDTGMLGCKLQSRARKYLNNHQWQFAVRDYAAALEVADTMLNEPESRSFAIERYMRAALELIYAVRKHKPHTDLSVLIDTTQKRLAPFFSPTPIELVTAPLVDVAFSPISDVDDWIHMLLSYEARGQPLPH